MSCKFCFLSQWARLAFISLKQAVLYRKEWERQNSKAKLKTHSSHFEYLWYIFQTCNILDWGHILNAMLSFQMCPTYISCQSSYFVRWRKAHSEQRADPGCELPSPLLGTCCGCRCWGCWHSGDLAGPPCCGSLLHDDLCILMTPASWCLTVPINLSLMKFSTG